MRDIPPYSNKTTSREAAFSIAHDTNRLRRLIFELIKKYRGLTCDEVEEKTALRHQTASARITELRDMGFIEDSGKQRKTRSDRNAIVWIPMKKGKR